MTDMKQDEHGEYNPDAGSTHPVEQDDVGYIPCNAVLKYTFERYGERRYCTGMAVANFPSDAHDREYSQFCKHHQHRGAIMEHHEDLVKHGAYTTSHEHTFQRLPPHKQVIANDMYRSLLDESTYDFETDDQALEVDVSEHDFPNDEIATLVLDHPIPRDRQMRAKALWFAALDFITMESIREEQFRVAAEDTHEGRELAIGERVTYVATEDDFKEVTEEHHLNLPLSRIQTDYKEHLKFGGVPLDEGSETESMSPREWAMVVEPQEETPAPETTRHDTSDLADVEVPEANQ